MQTESLTELSAFRDALQRHEVIMLFKHSPICPTSARAFTEWERFCDEQPDTARLFVDVIEQRAVARAIAEECGVVHASPQAILFRRGEPVWSASHFEIKAQTLAAAWNERSSD